MSFLMLYDDKGTITERAIRAAAAYLAKHGAWPNTIHAHPDDLPDGPQVVVLDDKAGQTAKVFAAPYVLRYHLHVGA